jgi:hypothetical protein
MQKTKNEFAKDIQKLEETIEVMCNALHNRIIMAIKEGADFKGIFPLINRELAKMEKDYKESKNE